MKKVVMRVAFAILVLSVQAVQAQSLGVGLRAGTLGPGLEVTTGLGQHLNLRLGAHYFTYSHNDVLTNFDVDVRYDMDLTMATADALLDWFPFDNPLRLTGGVIYNASEATALVVPIENYTLEGHTFTPDKIGNLTALANYEHKISPYAGIGWGNAVSSRVSFAFDLGMTYTDAPNFEMEGTSLIAPTAVQASDLEAALSTFRFYPVLSVGITFALARK